MTVNNVKEELSKILYDEKYRADMLQEYDRIIRILGSAGASEHAAKEMVRLLK